MGVRDKPLAVGLIKQLALAPALSFAQTRTHQSCIPVHTRAIRVNVSEVPGPTVTAGNIKSYLVYQLFPWLLARITLSRWRHCRNLLTFCRLCIFRIGRAPFQHGGIRVMYYSYLIPSWRNGLHYATHTTLRTIFQEITAWLLVY